MSKADYVSLLEARCKFFTDHNYIPAKGGRPIFVPANWHERIFFRIVIPDFDVPQAQLTGSRIYIAKLWDEEKRTMVDVQDEIGIGTCLDSMKSDSPEEFVKSFKDLTKPEGSDDRYLPYGKRNYIIGLPTPIVGVFMKADSMEVLDKLRPFSSECYRDFHKIHLAKILEHDSYIPVENILGYETPKRFTERKNGFTGEMLIDWPPSVKYAESITGISMSPTH